MRHKGAATVFFCALVLSQASSFVLSGRAGDVYRHENSSYSYWALLAGSIILGAIWYAKKDLASPLALVAAGGLSNALDRMILGFVRDPIGIYALRLNIADIGIAAGVLWAIWLYTKDDARTHTIRSGIRN